MEKNTNDYIKQAANAFKNYQNTHDVPDMKFIRKIYEYILKIDELSEEEKNQLNDFIKNNQIDLSHIANVYLNSNNQENFKKRLMWMYPFHLSKPKSSIRKVKCNINIIRNLVKEKEKVKMLCRSQKAA